MRRTRRTLMHIDQPGVAPDGFTVDEGGIWIALRNGAAIRRPGLPISAYTQAEDMHHGPFGILGAFYPNEPWVRVSRPSPPSPGVDSGGDARVRLRRARSLPVVNTPSTG